MLTRNGIVLSLLSATLLAAGWFLGAGDLYYPAAAGATLLIIAVCLVWLWPIGVEVERTVEPNRVPAGDTAAVHLEIHNRSRFGTPVLELVDRITDTDGARLLVPRTARHSKHRARYALPTQRRGRIEIGPMSIGVADPFGLVRRRFKIPIVAELTVYPRPVDTGPPPLTPSVDPRSLAAPATPVSVGGDDFYTLRNYAPGDDLRRVHWPASAHRDDLVLRVEEVTWQNHCTILIDTRANTMSATGLDATAEVAAGLCLGALQHSDGVRMCTTSGYDSGTSAGPTQAARCLSELAVLGTGPGNLAAILADIGQPHRRPTTLIALTATVSSEDYDQLGALATHVPLFHFVLESETDIPAGSIGGYSALVDPADPAGSIRSAFNARSRVGGARRW